MFFKKSRKRIHIVIEDYIIRIVEVVGQNLDSAEVIVERPIPLGLIDSGKITDEVQFFNFIKDIVNEFSLKNRYVRFYVPNPLVIMRQIEFPSSLKDKGEIMDYIAMEIGKTIHLPFKEPVFDIHFLPEEDDSSSDEAEVTQFQRMDRAVLFAAPRDEMQRYTDIFVDASLHPITADVSALGIYRYFFDLDRVEKSKVYLFVELNIKSINISIFSCSRLEFLRYQELDIQLAGWKTPEESNGGIIWQYIEDQEIVRGVVSDEVLELGRIMNFYQFSMHQGEKKVTDIIILGDHPFKNDFYQQIKQQFNLSVQMIGNHQTKYGEVHSAFIPALGLAIEGDS